MLNFFACFFAPENLEELNPKNLLRLFLALKIILFSEVSFKDPPKIPFKTSINITSQGKFLFFEGFFLARLFLKR